MNAKVNWRKSAARDVRPFFGTVSLETSLERAAIQVFEDGMFHDEPTLVIEPTDVHKLRPAVRLNFDPASLSFDGVKREHLVLTVTAAQTFLKKTCVVATYPVDGEIPDIVAIGDDVLSKLGGGAHIDVSVVLCLGKQLEKQAGSPFLRGHWLSKKSFALRPPKLAEEFDVESTEDDVFMKLGYPAKTLYLVEYFGGINEPVSKDRQTARVRVHSDIYKKLTNESQQKLAKPILNGLAAEIACQMLATSIADWEHADEVVQASPLSAFIKKLNRVQPTSLDDLKAMAKQPGMPKLRALIHADQGSVRSIAEA
ncbi:hypothetical protein [Variovorax paradoxus]|uniref:hypothetical protein n=1 Tax=Variovorax paradoxus TaxID=34073 RepID=UPI003ECD6520